MTRVSGVAAAQEIVERIKQPASRSLRQLIKQSLSVVATCGKRSVEVSRSIHRHVRDRATILFLGGKIENVTESALQRRAIGISRRVYYLPLDAWREWQDQDKYDSSCESS